MSNTKEKVLSIKDLKVSFSTDNGTVRAVRGVSFDLYRGETLCIVGESGSGKSVTSKTIMGILSHNAIIEGGEVLYRGEDLTKVSEEEFHRIRGKKIGMIFQDPLSSLNPLMRIGKQITEAMLINRSSSKKLFADLIAKDEINYRNAVRLLEREYDHFKHELDEVKSQLKKYIKKVKGEILKLPNNFDSLSDGEKKDAIGKAKDSKTEVINAAKEEAKEAIKSIKEEIKTFKSTKAISFKEDIKNKKCALNITKRNARNEVKEFKAKLREEYIQNIEKEKNDENALKTYDDAITAFEIDYNKLLDEAIALKGSSSEEYSQKIKDLKAFKAKELARINKDTPSLKTRLRKVKQDYAEKKGLTKAQAKEEALKVMKEVGIPQPERRFRQYPFEFSGGMRQRIVIAIALTANPEVLICDEPTTALDVTIQAQILELINRLKANRNLSCIFITHDLGVVANMADRVAVMYAGKIVEYGTALDIFYDPRHPYTWALLSSIPDVDSKEKLEAIPGTPPNMIYPPIGDAFAARSKYAMAIDFKKEPPLFKVNDEHYAATWLLDPRSPKVEMPKIVSTRIKICLDRNKALYESLLKSERGEE